MLWRTLWKGSIYLADSWGLHPRQDTAIDVMLGALEAKKGGKVGANIAWAMRGALRNNSLVDYPDSLDGILEGMEDAVSYYDCGNILFEEQAIQAMMDAEDVGDYERAEDIHLKLEDYRDSINRYSSVAITVHEPVVNTSLEDRLTEVYGHQAYKAIAASKFSGGWHIETDLSVKADQLHQADLVRDNVRELPSAGLELPDDLQRDDYPLPIPDEYYPTETDLRQLAKEMAVPMGKDWAPWHEEAEIFDILTTHISFVDHQARTKRRVKEGYFKAHNKAKKIGPIKVKTLKKWGVTDGHKAYNWGDLAALGRHTSTLIHIPEDRLESFMQQASQLEGAEKALEYLQ
ncbi:hypothetical protein LCGC14_1713780 [marine sediment metagenome]|uniref:Uncharacterized protein n=1 Tax=marine sediment metagenome TaxID=412755 RepID=A0A0F9KEF6_9ZZZZ